jgi:Ca2+-binding RTX toxin-like protein
MTPSKAGLSLVLSLGVTITAAGLAQGADNATPRCHGEKATIVDTSDDAGIYGTSGDDVIYGSRHIDGIQSGRGDDLICGGRGNDRIDSGPGADRVFGGLGRDSIDGDRGSDDLAGGPGEDSLASQGRDLLRGGKHDRDSAWFRDPVELDLAQGTVSGGRGIFGVEYVVGSRGDDVIKGDGRLNYFQGRQGDDTLIGRGGDDSLYGDTGYGNTGNDVLRGQKGADDLRGFAGDDVLKGGPNDDRLTGGEGGETIGDVGDGGSQDTEDLCAELETATGCEVNT